MYRFVLALALIPALCSSINGQSQEPSPDPVEVNDRKSDIEWDPLTFAGPDDPAVSFLLEGTSNNYFGTGAGASNTSGVSNSFFGGSAGNANTSGNSNSFFGWHAGSSNTTGSGNSSFGTIAGSFNTGGHNNSFFGSSAGFITTSSYNSFFGASAGGGNTTGESNSFFGVGAGNNNMGNNNAFFGALAGVSNTGSDGSFFGYQSGYWNTSGYDNVFLGREAGFFNTTGCFNAFLGRSAGYSNTVENGNTLVGYAANLHPGPDPATNPVTNATAIGYRAFVGRSNSLILGSIAGLNLAASYVNVGIGTPAPERQLHLAGPNAVFRMDRSTDTAAFIMVRTDATGVTPWKSYVVGTNASGVDQGEFIINDVGTAVGGLGNRRMTITNDGSVRFTGNVSAPSFTNTSSLALKTNVRTYENALDTVNRLRGVRFNWKDTGMASVGLIAEEVDQVLPEIVAQEDGKATGVNYANLVAVLVEAVKEQQRTIEEQQTTIERLEPLEKASREQQARIERLERLLEQRQP